MYDVPRGVEYGLAFYLDRPLPAPPPDEVVKFGTAGAGVAMRSGILKDVTDAMLPAHGNYVVILRIGEVERFAATLPAYYRLEPFLRFQPQRLDLYYLRDVSSSR
jgi:hypothetical protein